VARGDRQHDRVDADEHGPRLRGERSEPVLCSVDVYRLGRSRAQHDLSHGGIEVRSVGFE
jgi:hypothetical protein